MKILVTCDRYPSSLHDGLVLRVLHYIGQLRERHSFDLVCLDRQAQQPVQAPEVDALFGRVVRLPFAGGTAHRGWQRIRSAFDPCEHYPRSAAATQAINGLLAERGHDLIWDAGANMMNSLHDARTRAPLLADQVDDSFIRLRREIAAASGLQQGLQQGLRLRKQLLLEQQFARRYLAPSAAVLFVSPVDAASFKGVCPQARTASIANGVDAAYFAPGSAAEIEVGRLVFEGSMQFEPNVDAMLGFTQRTFELIRARRSDARLSIVGRDPVAAIQALASAAIEVTATVADVRPWLRRAQVFVCPMRMGAGIKNKILQAWAMGLPVVSTTAGAQGLDAHDGHNIVIRDTEQGFAEAVLELLADGERARRIGGAGRSTVQQHYGWKSKAEALERLFDTVAGQAP